MAARLKTRVKSRSLLSFAQFGMTLILCAVRDDSLLFVIQSSLKVVRVCFLSCGIVCTVCFYWLLGHPKLPVVPAFLNISALLIMACPLFQMQMMSQSTRFVQGKASALSGIIAPYRAICRSFYRSFLWAISLEARLSWRVFRVQNQDQVPPPLRDATRSLCSGCFAIRHFVPVRDDNLLFAISIIFAHILQAFFKL